MVREQALKRHVQMTSEKVIETALVVDKQTLDYHGSYADLVAYMLDIMNVVCANIHKQCAVRCNCYVLLQS